MQFYSILDVFLDQEDVSEDDVSDSCGEGEDDGTGEEKVIAEFCQVSDTGGSGALGDWERHTKASSLPMDDRL